MKKYAGCEKCAPSGSPTVLHFPYADESTLMDEKTFLGGTPGHSLSPLIHVGLRHRRSPSRSALWRTIRD